MTSSSRCCLRPCATQRAIHACWVLLVAAVAFGSSAVSASHPRLPNRIELYVGSSRVIEAAATRVAIGDGTVVSVTSLRGKELLFLGERVGSTTVDVWLDNGTRHDMKIDIVPANLESVAAASRELLAPFKELSVRVAAHRVIIEGPVANSRSRERAASVAALYPGIVLNLVGANGWENMIHFDVRIVEARSSALQDLGFRWREDINGPNAAIVADMASAGGLRATPVGEDVSRLPIPVSRAWSPQTYLGWTATLDSRIRLLEERGDAYIVARPMLSCRSGGAARFVSGGELPIPVADRMGATDVEFKEYGVILDVRPIADETGLVLAHIDTEVSQVDESQTVLGVPGILKRRAATEVNLRPGETLVIAGLVNKLGSLEKQSVPGLGRIPILGSVFRAKARRNAESELAIFITPRLVSAAASPQSIGSGADPSNELGDRVEGRVRATETSGR